MEEKNKRMEQEEVNKRLQEISKILKSMDDIRFNYIEYMSAMIYAAYKNKEKFKNVDFIKSEEIPYIVRMLDGELYQLREKENARRLFINIRFDDTINRKNLVIFEVVIKELIKLIFEIENLGGNSKEVLAEAFEYIIKEAAQNNEISFQNGEFYTPEGVIKTMLNLLDIRPNMAIYNPACGTGNFITEMAKYGNVYVFGEENNISNYNICNINLWLHNISNKRIKEDTEEEIQLVDLAIANPPFVGESKKDVQDIEYYQWGALSSASSYTKYLVRMLKSLRKHGRMAIIVPHGFLFKKTNSEYWVRRELISKNYIEAIIGLPEKLFYNTKIPVVILLINKAKVRKKVLFMDASREYTGNRKNNILTAENQKKIVDTYREYKVIPDYSYIADLEEIEENDYDLNIKKYVQMHTKIEEVNEKEIREKISDLEDERSEIQKKIGALIRKQK